MIWAIHFPCSYSLSDYCGLSMLTVPLCTLTWTIKHSYRANWLSEHYSYLWRRVISMNTELFPFIFLTLKCRSYTKHPTPSTSAVSSSQVRASDESWINIIFSVLNNSEAQVPGPWTLLGESRSPITLSREIVTMSISLSVRTNPL